MTSRRFLVPALLLLVTAASAGAGNWNSPPPIPGAVERLPLVPLGTAGEYAVVEVGSSAPDFSFEGPDGSWRRLHDLRGQGSILMVFGATQEQLVALEQQRPQLLRMGIVPVAILDCRRNSCRSTTERLHLNFVVVPDAQRVIAAQFHALSPGSRAHAPAWFVLDQRGNVRALSRFEWPTRAWTEVAGNALGLPVLDAPVPASHR